MNKVLVIGLDGATWSLIKPLVEQGKLPTFETLMKGGVYGGLLSTLPPVTGPAWVSFATGKNPGKHGVFDFLLPGERLDRAQTVTSGDIRSETFYEILHKRRLECILVNLPVSFPPRVPGIVITSLLTKGDNCIFPPTLVDERPELRGYRICADGSLIVRGRNAEYLQDVLTVERKRFECAKALFEHKGWDLFFVMFGGMDSCQHRVYDKLRAYADSKGAVFEDDIGIALELFRCLDGFVKWFVANAPPGTNIFIMSDHGACSFGGSFAVNAWLEKEGYLRTEVGSGYEQPPIHRLASEVRAAGLARQRHKWQVRAPSFMEKCIRQIGSSDGILHKTLRAMYRLLGAVLHIRMAVPARLPNVGKSTAIGISHSSRAIYVNSKGRFANGTVEAGEEYERVRNKIMTGLRELRSPTTGEKVLSDVLRKEDVYRGPFLPLAPDILLVPDRYFISVSPQSGAVLIDDAVRNDHDMEGILLAYGRDIAQGLRISGATIYDVAPTILHVFGLPIPNDMDGRVLTEILEEGSELASREVEFDYGEAHREIWRLRAKIKRLRHCDRL
jgi:predicted AlkP superfamily phosphohydrolase/phosphomutase